MVPLVSPLVYNLAVVISKLTRKTKVDPAEWDQRVERFFARAKPLLERQAGFAGIELVKTDGGLLEATRWHSMDDCRRYVRDGAAATVAVFADALFPTAPYPDGAWTRENVEE